MPCAMRALVWRAILLFVSDAPTATSLSLRQPNTLKKDLHSVQIFSNDKYVDRQKYLRLVDAISKPVLGQKGLTTGIDFASMVKFDVTKVMASRVMIIPEMEFDNILTLAPEVNKTLKHYVESGHLLMVGLADPEGMDNPVTFLNNVFGLSLEASAVTPGSDLSREEIDGFAWPFEKAPETLPYVDNVYGVTRGSLPSFAYKVYVQGDSIGVFILPYGGGLIVGYGLDYGADDSPGSEPWRTVLRLIVDEGRFLDKIRLGMSVIRHQGSTFGRIEARGNWSETGREDLPPKGLACKAWRRTLNCDPSGPRDFHGDKNCTAIVPEGESGFCECEGYVQTAAAPCNHRLISCKSECAKIDRRYKDVYGDAYKPPGLHEMHDLVEDAYRAHHENMMSKADEAVANVDAMVKAMKNAHDEVADKLKAYKDVPMWKQLHEAGRAAADQGKKAQDMASLAHPFLPDSPWTFPKTHPNPPPPPYSRYMETNPTYQAWLKENLAYVKNTPVPTQLPEEA